MNHTITTSQPSDESNEFVNTITHAKSRLYAKYSQWIYALVVFHTFLWTIIPTWVRSALPIDSMESTVWGRQLEWGYDKNPYLNAWLSELAISIAGQKDWIIYFFAQLGIAICFLAVWRLARKFLSPLHALVVVFLLEGIQYFNLAGIDFNDNLIELPLWALTTLFFYRSFQQQKWYDWALTGLFAGLAMMDKYFTVMLLIPLALFLLVTSQGRKSFFKPGIYLGLTLFLLVIIPHVVWLFHHDFITVQYAFYRVGAPPTFITHITHPAYFAMMQFFTFLPVLVLFAFVYFGRGTQVSSSALSEFPATAEREWVGKSRSLAHIEKQFLLFSGLGPFILTCLVSMITGITLQMMWGTPLLILWTLLLVAWTQPIISQKQFHRFVMAVFIFLIVLSAGFAYAFSHTGNTSKAQFPGKMIASDLTQRWHERYHTPLRYVAGLRWYAGNVSFYSPDRPVVYIDWQAKVSPWIDEQQLRKWGAIFVWEITPKQQTLPRDIVARFPRLEILPNQLYPWMNSKNVPPLQIGVGFLPPNS